MKVIPSFSTIDCFFSRVGRYFGGDIIRGLLSGDFEDARLEPFVRPLDGDRRRLVVCGVPVADCVGTPAHEIRLLGSNFIVREPATEPWHRDMQKKVVNHIGWLTHDILYIVCTGGGTGIGEWRIDIPWFKFLNLKLGSWSLSWDRSSLFLDENDSPKFRYPIVLRETHVEFPTLSDRNVIRSLGDLSVRSAAVRRFCDDILGLRDLEAQGKVRTRLSGDVEDLVRSTLLSLKFDESLGIRP